jgi:cell division protein FtsB
MFKSVRTVARLLAELDALRHENDCLQHRVAQLDYPCSPHSDGYLREQKLARENADLRAERDAMQARVEEAEDNAWNEARELVRGTNADLCKTPGAAYRVIGEAMTNAVNNRNLRTLQGRVDALAKKRANSTPDPDLVLARKGAAQGEPSKINAECIRAGAGDGSAAVQSALRALKLARERGNG